jgi:hypothetical protein
VLTLLFFLHRENGDFSILMKDMLLIHHLKAGGGFCAFWGKSLSCVHQLCFLTGSSCCSFLSTMCECNHKVVYFLNNFFCSGVVG